MVEPSNPAPEQKSNDAGKRICIFPRLFKPKEGIRAVVVLPPHLMDFERICHPPLELTKRVRPQFEILLPSAGIRFRFVCFVINQLKGHPCFRREYFACVMVGHPLLQVVRRTHVKIIVFQTAQDVRIKHLSIIPLGVGAWHTDKTSVNVPFGPRIIKTLIDKYRAQRNPTLLFVLPVSQFRFSVNGPAFEPLFQLPPRIKTPLC